MFVGGGGDGGGGGGRESGMIGRGGGQYSGDERIPSQNVLNIDWFP